MWKQLRLAIIGLGLLLPGIALASVPVVFVRVIGIVLVVAGTILLIVWNFIIEW